MINVLKIIKIKIAYNILRKIYRERGSIINKKLFKNKKLFL